ncbi:MAG TPA: glycoside hydrolase family 44 protein, partial [Polyangiaceae bacterium]|nr:glycoside hydrolase family 44 protein [Polyangiaceae bacterium]
MKNHAYASATIRACTLGAVLAACGGDGSSATSSGTQGRGTGDASSGGGSGSNDASASIDASAVDDSGTSEASRGGTGPSGGDSGSESGVPGDADAQTPLSCGAPLPAPLAGSRVALQVDVCAARHGISSDIYGATFFWSSSDTAELQFAKDVRLPLNRLGGDATTRYNWQVDASNSGFDWYFMAGGSGSSPVAGASDDAIIALDNMVGAETIITIPIIDYVNKNSATSCSYPKSLYPTQDKFNPYVSNCGNGQSGGKPIPNTNVSDHDVPNDPSIQAAWIQHLVGKFGSAAHGGVRIYEMD